MSKPGTALRSGFSLLAGCPRDVAQSAGEFISACRRSFKESARQDGWLHFVALGLIVALAVAIRIAAVNRPMDYDETVTFLRFASKPYAQALSDYSIPNNHLLNTAFIRLGYLLFGAHPWVVRLPALIAGVLIAPAAYLFGRTHYDKNTGLLAAALTAASTHLTAYSVSGRGYTLVAMFFMLALALAGSLKTRWNSFGGLLLAVVGALMMYAVPIGLYPLIVTLTWLALSILIERRPQIDGRMVVGAAASLVALGMLTLALYLPVFLHSGLEAVTQNTYVSPVKSAGYLPRLLDSLPPVWEAWNTHLPPWVTGLILAGFAAGLVFQWRISSHRLPVALVAVPLLAIGVTVQQVIPEMRIWLFLLPLYLTTASAGLVCSIGLLRRALPEKALAWGMVALPLLAAIGLGWLTYRDARQTMWAQNPVEAVSEPIALAIGADIRPDDAILSLSKDYPTIRFYLFEHFGEAGIRYANWSQIMRGEVTPGRLFIVILREGDGLQAPPEDVISARGLQPGDYDISPETQAFGEVVLYTAHRR